MPILGLIIDFLSGWFARFLGVQALRFLALKSLLIGLAVIVFPTIIFNILSELLRIMYDIVNSVTGGINPFEIQLIGITGYLAGILQIKQALSLIISAAIIRFAISFIPFVGPR